MVPSAQLLLYVLLYFHTKEIPIHFCNGFFNLFPETGLRSGLPPRLLPGLLEEDLQTPVENGLCERGGGGRRTEGKRARRRRRGGGRGGEGGGRRQGRHLAVGVHGGAVKVSAVVSAVMSAVINDFICINVVEFSL